MANFVCDICGGKLTMQSGGVGVCSVCGMEYSNERLREMAGAVPVQTEVKKEETPVVATMPVTPEDSKIKNYLAIAENEINAGFQGNKKKAEEYCDKVLEIDINNFDAWYWKIQVNISCQRHEAALKQSANLYYNAHLSAEQKRKAAALVKEVMQSWRDSYMGNSWSLIVPAIAYIVDVEDGDIYVEVARKALKGLYEQLANADKRVDEFIAKEYMWKTEYFANNDGDFVVREVKSVLDTMSKIPEKMYARLAEPMAEDYREALRIYKRLPDMYYDGGNYFDDAKKKDARVATLDKEIKGMISVVEDVARAEKRRLEEIEYQKRVAKGEAYWAQRLEEKKQLEDELEKVSVQWDVLGARLRLYENDSAKESELKKQIANCKTELSGLSIFKGKEKKAIKEKIAELEGQLETAKAERMAQKAETQKEYDVVDKKYEDLSNLLIDGR